MEVISIQLLLIQREAEIAACCFVCIGVAIILSSQLYNAKKAIFNPLTLWNCNTCSAVVPIHHMSEQTFRIAR